MFVPHLAVTWDPKVLSFWQAISQRKEKRCFVQIEHCIADSRGNNPETRCQRGLGWNLYKYICSRKSNIPWMNYNIYYANLAHLQFNLHSFFHDLKKNQMAKNCYRRNKKLLQFPVVF